MKHCVRNSKPTNLTERTTLWNVRLVRSLLEEAPIEYASWVMTYMSERNNFRVHINDGRVILDYPSECRRYKFNVVVQSMLPRLAQIYTEWYQHIQDTF